MIATLGIALRPARICSASRNVHSTCPHILDKHQHRNRAYTFDQCQTPAATSAIGNLLSTYKIASTSYRLSALYLESLPIGDTVPPIACHSNHSTLSAKIRKRTALSVRVLDFHVVRETAHDRWYVFALRPEKLNTVSTCTSAGSTMYIHRNPNTCQAALHCCAEPPVREHTPRIVLNPHRQHVDVRPGSLGLLSLSNRCLICFHCTSPISIQTIRSPSKIRM